MVRPFLKSHDERTSAGNLCQLRRWRLDARRRQRFVVSILEAATTTFCFHNRPVSCFCERCTRLCANLRHGLAAQDEPVCEDWGFNGRRRRGDETYLSGHFLGNLAVLKLCLHHVAIRNRLLNNPFGCKTGSFPGRQNKMRRSRTNGNEGKRRAMRHVVADGRLAIGRVAGRADFDRFSTAKEIFQFFASGFAAAHNTRDFLLEGFHAFST